MLPKRFEQDCPGQFRSGGDRRAHAPAVPASRSEPCGCPERHRSNGVSQRPGDGDQWTGDAKCAGVRTAATAGSFRSGARSLSPARPRSAGPWPADWAAFPASPYSRQCPKVDCYSRVQWHRQDVRDRRGSAEKQHQGPTRNSPTCARCGSRRARPTCRE
ncbi:hypothetical protein AMJ85_09825 [candidate division BRC1 bacterium SM23_51]|nr:MAG: hypothetical protein AMJ85_09825 [candidate division BRC1 bacterium SM23_51]